MKATSDHVQRSLGSHSRKTSSLALTATLAVLLISWQPASMSCCQEPVVGQESTAISTEELALLRSGLEKVTENRVKETISFLASDELAGRDTLSVGFDRAAQYAVERLQAAGIEPGADGEYFHKTKVAATRVPSEGVVLKDSANAPFKHFGLLGSGSKAAEWKGTIPLVDLSLETPSLGQPGPIAADFDSMAGTSRVVNQIVRSANRWFQAGATALVLRVDPKSDLVATAAQWQGMLRMENPRSRFNIPVLLVPNDLPWDSENAMTLALPAEESIEAEACNIIGILPGKDRVLSREYVMFSAHLDHIGVAASGEDRIYNGADDNASGVTAVLSLADAFAAIPERPNRSIVFMLFWGEERGLLGSRAFVKTPTMDLKQIVACINIEMIGRPEEGAFGKVWMTGWEKSDLGSLMQKTSAEVGVDIFEHPRFSSMLYGSSDNYAFAEAGVVAHSFSAGSLHEDYHQVTDEWTRLQLPHMTKVIQGLLAGSWKIVQGEVTPKGEASSSKR